MAYTYRGSYSLSILENKIKIFTESYRQLIATQQYHVALTIGLTLPDICTKLENPGEKSTCKRYVQWFDKYMAKKYHANIGPKRILHVFLSGNDFYALRCSFLHQGETNIEEQKARDVLKDFVFVRPQLMSKIHLNRINDTLQLQVDIFCVDILLAVEDWLEEHKENEELNERAKNIIEINNEIRF
jgi:hypothetical protein